MAILLSPGVLVVYLSLNAGGFFPGATGVAAAAVALVLAGWILLSPRPFQGVSWGLVAAGAALALYVAWTLASGEWSGSQARALVEFDRALLYLLVFLLFGFLGRASDRARLALIGVAVAIVAVCAIAFVSRVLPDLLPTDPNRVSSRLSYPLGYWNSLGLLAGLGIVLCLHFASSAAEHPVSRVLGSGAVPLLGATLLLTFSRGGIAVTAVSLLAYLALARNRSLLTALPVVVPFTALAVMQAYGAESLASSNPTSPMAVVEGKSLALGVLGCSVAAAVLRAALLPVDRRLAWVMVSPGVSRTARRLLAVCAVAGTVLAGLALDLPERASSQYERFVKNESVIGKERDRLTNPANNGRLDQWRVALRAFDQHSINGRGAGTYQVIWAKDRPGELTLNDAHSLYLEVLAELGIVGLALLVIALAMIVGGFALKARGEERALYAALLAAALAWLLHAGLDWDWEVPAVTAWLFALGGLVLARSGRTPTGPGPRRSVRLAGALGCLVIAVAPALVALSQRRLNHSVRALKAGDCPRAVDLALASRSAVPARPEPFQVLGFCDSRLGRRSLAITVMRRAVRLDPDNWEFQYSLALVTGAAGRDPRPAARAALRLNPRSALARQAVRQFDTADRRSWTRRARRAPLPFQQ